VKISCFNFFTEKKGSNHFPLFYLYTISEQKNKKWQPLFQSTTCAGLGYCVAASLADKRMQIEGRQALQAAEVQIDRASSSFLFSFFSIVMP